MGVCCHSKYQQKEKQPQQQQFNIKIIYPSGKETLFSLKPDDSVYTLLQQIFEDAPITQIDDRIIPGQQMLISQQNPTNVVKFSDKLLVQSEILPNETFMLAKTELELNTSRNGSYQF